MWWSIQLADRRGLLTGRGLSRVQTRAIELLLLDEDGVFSRGRDAIRKGLVATTSAVDGATKAVAARVGDLGGNAVVDELTEDNADEDGEGMTWLMPEDFTGADAMEVLAQIGSSVALGDEDFDGND